MGRRRQMDWPAAGCHPSRPTVPAAAGRNPTDLIPRSVAGRDR